ncbi:MAG: penicillin-binding transpeptidase domain-containing protein [Desulfitobacteriaceae bacterium]|nr:penicillin-binding transpeptidase domain-containing protein [Desulfitobacteriaceae bacterium]
MQQKYNKKIINVLIFISVLFLSVIGYLTYFEFAVKNNIVSSSYNRRLWAREDRTLRGTIYDRRGVVLAKSELQEEKQERIYPHGSLYSHIIGYNSISYGKSLLEARFNNELLNINPLNPVLDFKDKLTGGKSIGNDLFLTLDHRLQEKAAELLGKRNGAVVVLNPRTGQVLAMVSKPDFNPNKRNLEKNWNELVESEVNPFLPRATQGLYAPGSTYKVAVSAMAIEKGLDAKTFQDEGSVVIEGKSFSNYGNKAFGTLDLTKALAVSSNVVFAQLGVELGADNLKELAERVGMGKKIPFDIPVSESRFPYQSMNKTDQAAVGIGQGKILMTPLQVALIAAGIANDGLIMRPYIVDRIISQNGFVVKTQRPAVLYHWTTREIASEVKEMMYQVVANGTGRNAQISGIKVAGKTGTAQNELTEKTENKEHAWFIGFAPVEDPQIAVAVIVEYSGSTGGGAAAPIARELMANWLGR